MKVVTLKEVEYIAFRLAREKFSFDEPIPDFSSRKDETVKAIQKFLKAHLVNLQA